MASDRPFRFQTVPQCRDAFNDALRATLERLLENPELFIPMKAAAEFIREHDELETGSSVWADVEDSFARHALADYIDAIMRHNLEIAEKEKTA